jgi:hypothetical protein
MNTLEKRKLEGIVLSKLSRARERFQRERNNVRDELIATVRETPSKEMQKVRDKLKTAWETYESQSNLLRAEAQKLGYTCEINSHNGDITVSLHRTSRYENDEYVYVYTEPSIVAHDRGTADRLSQLDDLSAKYTIEIWSETGDMPKLVEKLDTELAKLEV